MADRWEQFKRAKDIADAWAGWGAGVLMSPVEAARDIATNYRPGAENEPLNQDIGRQGFAAGPSALMLPGVARAAGGAGELGVAAGRIMQRADAQKLVREMLAEKRTTAQIAEALNERFAPILDEGSQVTGGMVAGRKHRGEYTVGAMGGEGRGASRISADDVVQTMRELGLDAQAHVASSGTAYVRGRDPQGPVNPGTPDTPKGVEVRVPAADDPHPGRSKNWRYDTVMEGKREPNLSQMNIAGEPYEGNLPALRDRLAYVFGKEPPTKTAAAPALTEPPDPRQLKLLAGGTPAPGGWQTTVEPAEPEPAPMPEGAGRFARQLIDPDAALVKQTREMTERMKQQQRTIWDQFERVDAQ